MCQDRNLVCCVDGTAVASCMVCLKNRLDRWNVSQRTSPDAHSCLMDLLPTSGPVERVEDTLLLDHCTRCFTLDCSQRCSRMLRALDLLVHSAHDSMPDPENDGESRLRGGFAHDGARRRWRLLVLCSTCAARPCCGSHSAGRGSAGKLRPCAKQSFWCTWSILLRRHRV